MIDIEKIRQQPDAFRHAIAAKRVPIDLDRLLIIDERRRALNHEVNQLREQRNKISDLVAAQPANKQDLIAQSRQIGEALGGKEKELQHVECEYTTLMGFVPSIPAEDVPIGETDQDNIEISRIGSPGKRLFR